MTVRSVANGVANELSHSAMESSSQLSSLSELLSSPGLCFTLPPWKSARIRAELNLVGKAGVVGVSSASRSKRKYGITQGVSKGKQA